MIKFLHSVTYQDYAKECFELSRDSDDLNQTEVVEKAWLSDVANYIVKLENFVRFQESERVRILSTGRSDIEQEEVP